MNSGKLK